MLKVCFVGGTSYSEPLDATSEKKFLALKALGELHVIGMSRDIRPRGFAQHAMFHLLPRLPLPILRYAEMFGIGSALALWLVVRRGVQVLVAQSPYEGCAAALVKRIARWFGRKVVLVVESHGDFEESLFLQRHIVFPILYRILMRAAVLFALSNADVLRAVSQVTRGQLERWAPGRIVIQFPAWTDFDVFLRAGEEATEPSQDILYAGVLVPGKGVHVLINAFSQIASEFPAARLVVIGRPQNRVYAKQLSAQVSRLGIVERARFQSEVPQSELAQLMGKACVFTLPSLSEGLGRVILEAMATGRPVIGSCVGGIPEVVQDGETGFLVPVGDESALAERLRWVIRHPLETKDMGRRAREYARRFFSTEAYVDGYKQVLDAARPLLLTTETTVLGRVVERSRRDNQNVLRICFIGGAQYSQPLDRSTEKKFVLLKGLGQCFVIGFSRDMKPRRFSQSARFFLLPQLPWPLLRYTELFTVGPMLALWSIFRHGVQVLIAQSPYEGCAAAWAKVIAGWFGRRVVLLIESHGDFEKSLFLQRRVLAPQLYGFCMYRTAAFAFKHADVLRAVSHSTRKQLERWAPRAPVFQFATWTDIDMFLRVTEEARQDSAMIVLYAGVIIPRKGVHNLLGAFRRIGQVFPQAQLVIIGRPDNKAYAARLNVQVDQWGLRGRVQMVGEVSQGDLAQWMNRASVFVLPSLSEGLPRVIGEAMAAGTPVIASCVDGIPEIVQDGVTGFLVPVADESAIAARIRWLLSHPSVAQEMGQRARAVVRQFFCPESYLDGYKQILETARNLLSGPGRYDAASGL